MPTASAMSVRVICRILAGAERARRCQDGVFALTLGLGLRAL